MSHGSRASLLKLILHTGRLSALQGSLSSSATLLPPLLPSPVLQNTLAQLSSSPSYTLQTSTLITPLRTRLDQLISYPTTRLHLAGQSALLGILGRVGGTGIAIYLLGVWSGIGIAGASGPGTAAGILALSLLVGVRWSMGKWERAKKRWWGDWSRLGEGLRRDLEVNYLPHFAIAFLKKTGPHFSHLHWCCRRHWIGR